jgi:hypothetical protein
MADFFDTTGGRSMELFCHCSLDGVGLQFRSATSSPSGTCCFKSCFGALGNSVMLKLRQHRKKLKKQLARRCVSIDIFCQRHHVAVPFFQFFKRLDELLQRSSESVQFPHHQGISFVQICNGCKKCLAVKADTGLLIGEKSHTTSLFQGI